LEVERIEVFAVKDFGSREGLGIMELEGRLKNPFLI
jgi:hypothetical protein